jgi:cysteinyl-tRNA synthetase
MELRLYDTLTKEKRPFTPLDPKNVRMYVCGPTVYDFAHIGNARPVIVFDVLFRLLRHLYGEKHVTYVRNITDVDDKINDRAARDFPGLPLNDAIRKVTELTEKQFHEDVDALGALRPTVEPRATEHIGEMRAIIEKLVAGGFAYVAEDHVLFSPQAMNAASSVLPRYGALANRSLDEMIAGARVDVAPYKRDNTDFVLWKPAKPGEPSWPSPAGIAAPGRPGWHIECSAMAWKHLGEQFDIHGGGIDLVFPHHENELAQSCCAFHANRMANTWMHNGFLQVEGEKMSKSLGNFITIRELLADWPGEVLRLNMLKTHYRSPIDWTAKALEESAKTLDDWYAVANDAKGDRPAAAVVEALSDDLNTPQMIAALHSLRGAAVSGEEQRGEFAASLRLVGFLSESAEAWKGRKQQASGVDAKQIDRLIADRAAARARKDFKESDRIRDELAAMGIAIKDGKDADGKPVTTWEIA